MKRLPLLSLILIAAFAFACDYSDYAYEEGYYEDGYYSDAYYDEATAQPIASSHTPKQTQAINATYPDNSNAFRKMKTRNQQSNQLKYFPVYDPNYGMVSRYVPLPAHWKVADLWSTPTGSKTGYVQGGPVNVTSVDQVIQQIFLPKFQNTIRVVGMEDLPQIARADQQEQEGYYSYMPTQNHTQAKGIEYVETSTGNRGYFIIHYLLKASQVGRYAYYWGHNLYSTGNTFDQDKKAFIYALANTQINPEYLAAYNRKEAGQLAANDAAFQRKMAARQQSFNSAMATSRTNSDISDIYQETWRNTSGMNDRGHESSINGIHERNAMVNPYTGANTNIQSGYKYYYMNQSGQYFGTNDEFYSPERDPNINHQEWRKMQYRGNN